MHRRSRKTEGKDDLKIYFMINAPDFSSHLCVQSFIDSTVDSVSLNVQGQLIYTVYIYIAPYVYYHQTDSLFHNAMICTHRANIR